MRRGFTVVELLIVIVVIGILATLTIISYSHVQAQAMNATVESNLDATTKALGLYYARHGDYPHSTTGYDEMKQSLRLTTTQDNTLLYCVDTAAPDTYIIFATGYTGEVYYWNSEGLRSPTGGSMGSGYTVCQAAYGGTGTVVGIWASYFAILST